MWFSPWPYIRAHPDASFHSVAHSRLRNKHDWPQVWLWSFDNFVGFYLGCQSFEPGAGKFFMGSVSRSGSAS